MPPDDERDYEVGYGKPPRHTRFEPGRSGNPRGRPPGAKNMKTLLSKALNELVVVTEPGGRRKVSKRKAIVVIKPSRSYWGWSAISRATPTPTPPMRLSPRPTSKSSNASGQGSGTRKNEPQ